MASEPSPSPKILLAKPGIVAGGPVAGKFGRGGAGDDDTAQLRSRLPSVASLNLLSDSWDFHIDRFLPFLTENTDFTVIGVIGPPGVGKSTIMNEIYGFDSTSPGMLPPFGLQSEETRAMARHCSTGIEPRVSSERIILLDTQPVFSASVLGEMMRPDGSSTISVISGESLSAELAHEIMGIQLAVLLASVCHILLVVSEGVHDDSMWHLMLTVDLLKHGISDPSLLASSVSQSSSSGLEKDYKVPDHEEYMATSVFIHTKLHDLDFTPQNVVQLRKTLTQYFKPSSFVTEQHTGSKQEEHVSSCVVHGSNMDSNMLNFYAIPLKKKEENQRAQHESFVSALWELRDQILSMKSPSFTRSVSEREWLKNSAKIWEQNCTKSSARARRRREELGTHRRLCFRSVPISTEEVREQPSIPFEIKMMRLKTYAGLSLIATLAITYHAFNSRGQFYPAMVYLSTSKISLVLLLNMGLVIMCILWQLTKKIFLGSLREAEVERLNEQSWREVMEILFAITIFRQDFSVTFLAMVTALLLIKALHWLAQKRVEYIETTPSVPMLSHVRIVSFMGFLLLLDSLFLYNSMKHLLQSWQPSVSIFFSFEYMILATTTVSIFVKYLFYVSDMLMEGQWERKPVFTFYLELVRDLLHLSMYLCFFLVIFVNYGVPLHLIRELYETFRNFKVRVADYIRYRRITSNMNDRFPDASPEELNASDATCIICREEMTTAKKLICGHLFHVHCLRSWLERQHTCPTCRALVVPPENGATSAGGQQGSQSDAHRQGSGTGSSGQTDAGSTGASDNLSRHQARLQAAAAAASIYEKSYVYPSPTSLVCSPGHALHPQVQASMGESINSGLNGEQASSEQAQKQFMIPGGPIVSFPQTGHFHFLPSHAHPGPMNYGVEFGNDPNISNSLLEVQKKLIQYQIEILQNQLKLLQRTTADKSIDEGTSSSDSRGKQVASSSSGSGHGYHEVQDEKS